MARRLILSVLLPLASADLAFAQTPLGTSFTYQGRLTDGAVPASGVYDLRFTLFDTAMLLSPRQELTPSPNAVFSSTAPWTGVSGKPAGFADDIDNDSGGDVTGVTAGTGLAGGGTSGNVTLSADTAVVQSRVTDVRGGQLDPDRQ